MFDLKGKTAFVYRREAAASAAASRQHWRRQAPMSR
jgi:hypothetical protein